MKSHAIIHHKCPANFSNFFEFRNETFRLASCAFCCRITFFFSSIKKLCFPFLFICFGFVCRQISKSSSKAFCFRHFQRKNSKSLRRRLTHPVQNNIILYFRITNWRKWSSGEKNLWMRLMRCVHITKTWKEKKKKFKFESKASTKKRNITSHANPKYARIIIFLLRTPTQFKTNWKQYHKHTRHRTLTLVFWNALFKKKLN